MVLFLLNTILLQSSMLKAAIFASTCHSIMARLSPDKIKNVIKTKNIFNLQSKIVSNFRLCYFITSRIILLKKPSTFNLPLINLPVNCLFLDQLTIETVVHGFDMLLTVHFMVLFTITLKRFNST